MFAVPEYWQDFFCWKSVLGNCRLTIIFGQQPSSSCIWPQTQKLVEHFYSDIEAALKWLLTCENDPSIE